MKLNETYDFYKSKVNEIMRHEQAQTVLEVIENYFNFDYVEVIETGASSDNYDNFGILLGKIAESKNGIYHSVDINEEYVESSKKMYLKELPKLNIKHYIGDSVEFLKNYSGKANLIHLDSFDLDLFDPLPAILHGWLEFEAIKDKVPVGSICIIDDNWLNGTYIDSVVYVDGKRTEDIKRVDVTYTILGKGAMVYHYVKQRDSGWEVVGNHYRPGNNIKLLLRKIK